MVQVHLEPQHYLRWNYQNSKVRVKGDRSVDIQHYKKIKKKQKNRPYLYYAGANIMQSHHNLSVNRRAVCPYTVNVKTFQLKRHSFMRTVKASGCRVIINKIINVVYFQRGESRKFCQTDNRLLPQQSKSPFRLGNLFWQIICATAFSRDIYCRNRQRKFLIGNVFQCSKAT